MLDGLDDIDWKSLRHAYGPAGDVPVLIRALAITPPESRVDESPLGQLFGNIWHQGTVYEATSHAVPFLIELAGMPEVPNRVGILLLLAAIASGHSHQDFRRASSKIPAAELEQKRAQELRWVANAHRAVANGLETFVKLTEVRGDMALAAGNVLATLPEHSKVVGARLRGMLKAEKEPLARAGLLLLLGKCGDKSDETLELLLSALNADTRQQRAAAYAMASLRPSKVPSAARRAVRDALEADDLEEQFRSLPWDVMADLDEDILAGFLPRAEQDEAIGKLIANIDAGKGTHNLIQRLLDMAFPPGPGRGEAVPTVTLENVTATQTRALQALARTLDGKKRIFLGMYSQWGLPNSRRAFKDLAAGRPTPPVDMTLPMIARAERPLELVRPDQLKEGDKIISRYFGSGTVISVQSRDEKTNLKVEFDEEGPIQLALASDGSSPK